MEKIIMNGFVYVLLLLHLNSKLMNKKIILFCLIAFSLAFATCEKEDPVTKYPIAGLWIGTYTFKSQPPLYFAFTIYPDGSMSYKSKGDNGYTFYANGTWVLTGDKFTYDVTTVNNPGGFQSHQVGTATFSDKGKLTNGVNHDVDANVDGYFELTRVN